MLLAMHDGRTIGLIASCRYFLLSGRFSFDEVGFGFICCGLMRFALFSISSFPLSISSLKDDQLPTQTSLIPSRLSAQSTLHQTSLTPSGRLPACSALGGPANLPCACPSVGLAGGCVFPYVVPMSCVAVRPCVGWGWYGLYGAGPPPPAGRFVLDLLRKSGPVYGEAAWWAWPP